MAEGQNEIVGHGTLSDGTHVPITRAEADALWKAVEIEKAQRAAMMPDTKAALRALCDARQRLKELGWKEGQYCPKDGTEFAAIEYGSTGIFTGWFDGKWPYDFAQIEENKAVEQGEISDCGTIPPLAKNANDFRMVPKPGLEPGRLAAGDFESPASTIPPLGQRFGVLLNSCIKDNSRTVAGVGPCDLLPDGRWPFPRR